MKLLMPENQVLQSYKYAVNKREQVGILADLNCCTKQEMAQWLIDHGEHVDKRFFAQGRQKNTPLKKGLERAEKEKREMNTETKKVTESVNTGSNIPEPTTIPEAPRRVEEETAPDLTMETDCPTTADVSTLNQTAKADAGKPRLTLVPPAIMFEIAKIREYGNAKYHDPDNWKQVEPQRYWDACVRHIFAALSDYTKKDDESGLLHISHAACNLSFLLQMMEDKQS
jgi:hypothetical protein